MNNHIAYVPKTHTMGLIVYCTLSQSILCNIWLCRKYWCVLYLSQDELQRETNTTYGKAGFCLRANTLHCFTYDCQYLTSESTVWDDLKLTLFYIYLQYYSTFFPSTQRVAFS